MMHEMLEKIKTPEDLELFLKQLKIRILPT